MVTAGSTGAVVGSGIGSAVFGGGAVAAVGGVGGGGPAEMVAAAARISSADCCPEQTRS